MEGTLQVVDIVRAAVERHAVVVSRARQRLMAEASATIKRARPRLWIAVAIGLFGWLAVAAIANESQRKHPAFFALIGIVSLASGVLIIGVVFARWRSSSTSMRYRAASRLLLRADAMGPESQAKALDVLTSCMSSQAPYTLYLRDFRSEIDDDRLVIGAGVLGGPASIRPRTRRLDDAIVRTFDRHSPVFCIANVADPYPPEDAHRFYVSDEDWYDVIRALVPSAAGIAVYVNRLSAGIAAEITLLQSLGRQNNVVVVTAATHTETIRAAGFEQVVASDDPNDAIRFVSRCAEAWAIEGRLPLPPAFGRNVQLSLVVLFSFLMLSFVVLRFCGPEPVPKDFQAQRYPDSR